MRRAGLWYRFLPGLLAAGMLTNAVWADSAETGGKKLQLWDDPTFQKQFMGSYGFNAELEPTVTTVERERMEEILRLMQESNTTEAIVQLGETLKGESKRNRETAEPSAVFDFMLGNIYFQQDDLLEARTHYTNAIGKFPSYRRAHKNLGLVHVRMGDPRAAIGSLSRVIELGGSDGLTYGLLGYSYSSTDQYIAAESAYRNAMLLDPETLDWKLGLTLSVLKQQKFGEAVTLCEELIARNPDRADFWMLQANAYIGLDKPLQAAKNFEIVRRMGEANLQSLYTLGDIYVNENLWDLAARIYGEAVKADPDQDPARPLRNVEILAQRGALPQARTLLTQSRRTFGNRLGENQKKKLLKLEARIAVADGDGGSAAEVLEEVVALDPLDGEALILLGQHYTRIEDPERAVFYFERAQSLEKFEADASVRHAQLLVNQSKYNDAVRLLKRAQEIEPRDDVARFLEQVERVARTRN